MHFSLLFLQRCMQFFSLYLLGVQGWTLCGISCKQPSRTWLRTTGTYINLVLVENPVPLLLSDFYVLLLLISSLFWRYYKSTLKQGVGCYYKHLKKRIPVPFTRLFNSFEVKLFIRETSLLLKLPLISLYQYLFYKYIRTILRRSNNLKNSVSWKQWR